MLRPPYTRYQRLYTYHLSQPAPQAFDDPDLIGVWPEDETTILFFHRPKERLIRSLCEQYGCTIIYEADLDYVDWEAGREIGRFTVGGLSVASVWEAEADILLDPSVIFGSGFHPSTRLCLEGLLKYTATPELAFNSALDLGCGTGLLAIAAAKTGIGRIVACDHNPLACEVARANAARNGVADAIEVRQADLRANCPHTDGVDLVMANLYKALMLDLFAKPEFWRAKLYLLSGFIPAMEEELLAALPASGFKLLERRRSERWCFWALLRQ